MRRSLQLEAESRIEMSHPKTLPQFHPLPNCMLLSLTTTSVSIAGRLQEIRNHTSVSTTRITQRRFGAAHRKAIVQQLESRYVLSAFTFNTTLYTIDVNPGDRLALDSNGKKSLCAAVMKANAGAGADTITLPARNYQFTISPTTSSSAAVNGNLDLSANSVLPSSVLVVI